MSVVHLPPREPFWSGLTRIERKPNESREQFEATKATATFEVAGESHTLELDGKLDNVILEGIRTQYGGDKLITDVRQLQDKAGILREACLQSEQSLDTPGVDLGTGSPWYCFPQKDLATHQTSGYELINGPGPQTVSVRLEANGFVDACVSTKDKQRDIGHSMRARVGEDGSCDPWLEGVTWTLARPR